MTATLKVTHKAIGVEVRRDTNAVLMQLNLSISRHDDFRRLGYTVTHDHAADLLMAWSLAGAGRAECAASAWQRGRVRQRDLAASLP
jgi:hypothetical protein